MPSLAAIESYELPDDYTNTFKKLSTSKLMSLADPLTLKARGVHHSLTDYDDYDKRDRYLKLHLYANKIGWVAPAFRPLVKASSFKKQTEQESLATLDRQLIDLHYLFCNMRRHLNLRNGDGLVDFLSKEKTHFDFESASVFITTPGRRWVKAETMLGIPKHIQLRLHYFHSEVVRKKVKRAEEKFQLISSFISDYVASGRSRISEKKRIAIQSDLRPLILAEGDVKLALELKLAEQGIKEDIDYVRVNSKSLHESKRWLKQKSIEL